MIPVVIAVWVLAQIEKRLHKVVPAMLDLFVTPLVSVFVTGYLTLSIIGPVFVTLENGLLDGVQWLIALPFGIGSFIMGAFYAPTVVAGVHHMYTIIDLGQIAKFGMTFWLPLASAANLAQGGAALAVALKTKDQKIKSMAVPSALSACMGITGCFHYRTWRYRNRCDRNFRYPALPKSAGCLSSYDGSFPGSVICTYLDVWI